MLFLVHFPQTFIIVTKYRNSKKVAFSYIKRRRNWKKTLHNIVTCFLYKILLLIEIAKRMLSVKSLVGNFYNSIFLTIFITSVIGADYVVMFIPGWISSSLARMKHNLCRSNILQRENNLLIRFMITQQNIYRG